MTQSVRDQFGELVKKACTEFLNDRVKMRLQSAIDREPASSEAAETGEQSTGASADEKAVVTTLEELEGFHIVKSIVRSVVASDRVAMRDTQSYCGILLDDTNRKPICRLFFNQAQKYIGLFDAREELHSVSDCQTGRHLQLFRATVPDREAVRSAAAGHATVQ